VTPTRSPVASNCSNIRSFLSHFTRLLRHPGSTSSPTLSVPGAGRGKSGLDSTVVSASEELPDRNKEHSQRTRPTFQLPTPTLPEEREGHVRRPTTNFNTCYTNANYFRRPRHRLVRPRKKRTNEGPNQQRPINTDRPSRRTSKLLRQISTLRLWAIVQHA